MPTSRVFCRLLVVALLLVMALPPSPAQAATSGWEIYDLGLPYAASGIEAIALNHGATVLSSGSVRPFTWSYGTITDLTSAATTTVNGTTFTPAGLVDLNDAGTILGDYYSACSGSTCTGGSFLLNPSGPPTFINGQLLYGPSAVNNQDQVAGESSGGHAAIWQNGNVLVEDPGEESWAYDLNDQGMVVGAGPQDAYLWQNGVGTDLGNLPNGCGGIAYGINNAGQVVGAAMQLDSWGKCDYGSAFLWQNGVMTSLGGSIAYAINDSGEIVGTSSYGATLWQNGVMTGLNSVLPPNSGWGLTLARDINDLGQIVGEGTYQGVTHGFLLDPPSVPLHPYLSLAPTTAPGAATLLVSGGGYLPGESVTLAWNCPTAGCPGGTTLSTVTASGFGSLDRVPITIPSQALPGSYAIAGQGSSGTFSTLGFTVVPYLAATPNLAPAGGTTQLAGSGYAPNESIVIAGNCAAPGCPNGVPVGKTTTDASGSFAFTLTIPSGTPARTYPVAALGATSKGFGVANLTVGTPPVGPPTTSVGVLGSPQNDEFVNDPTLTTPLSVLWERDLGANVSYPVVGGGKVYVLTPLSATGGVTLTALDAATGATVWTQSLDEQYFQGYLLYDEGRVFLMDGQATIYAYDGASGAPLWQYPVPTTGLSQFTEPVASNGQLVVTGPADGYTAHDYFLNDATGQVRLTSRVMDGDLPAWTPRFTYFGSGCGVSEVSNFNSVTLWADNFCSGEGGGASTPVYHDGLVYDAYWILNATNGHRLGQLAIPGQPAFGPPGTPLGVVMSSDALHGMTGAGKPTWIFSGDGTMEVSGLNGFPTTPLVVGDVVFATTLIGNVDAVSLLNGQVLSEVNQGPVVRPSNQVEMPGLGAGEGILAVPSGTMLVVYR